MNRAEETSHHLSLEAAGWLGALHHVATLVEVFDVREAERATAVLVAGELRDSCGRIVLVGELDNAGATRTTIRLVLDFSTLDLTDRGEELD